jgi:hypothetical protein
LREAFFDEGIERPTGVVGGDGPRESVAVSGKFGQVTIDVVDHLSG